MKGIHKTSRAIELVQRKLLCDIFMTGLSSKRE